MTTTSRGFTLLIAVILTAVLLSVGLALLDIAYKQIVLSSTAKQSQTAFYAADSALECALYWDQQQLSFTYGAPAGSITCGNQSISVSSSASGGVQTSTFSIPCPGGSSATVQVRKGSGATACNISGKTTCIYASGYNACASNDPRRIERGLKVVY